MVNTTGPVDRSSDKECFLPAPGHVREALKGKKQSGHCTGWLFSTPSESVHMNDNKDEFVLHHSLSSLSVYTRRVKVLIKEDRAI